MIALLERVKRLRPPSIPPNPGGEISPPSVPRPPSPKVGGGGGSPGARLLGLNLGPLSSWLFGISRGHSVGVPNLLGFVAPHPQQVGDSGPLVTPTPTGRGLLSVDQRGATLVTYVLVLPLLILLVFGSFAVWRIMAIRQTLFLGTYKAAWELSQQARELSLDDPDEWWRIADSTIREEVEGRGGKGGNRLIDSGFTLDVAVTLPVELACPSSAPRLIDDILFTVKATLSLPAPIRIPFLDPKPITLTERHTSFVKCPRGWDPPPEEHIY